MWLGMEFMAGYVIDMFSQKTTHILLARIEEITPRSSFGGIFQTLVDSGQYHWGCHNTHIFYFSLSPWILVTPINHTHFSLCMLQAVILKPDHPHINHVLGRFFMSMGKRINYRLLVQIAKTFKFRFENSSNKTVRKSEQFSKTS